MLDRPEGFWRLGYSLSHFWANLIGLAFQTTIQNSGGTTGGRARAPRVPGEPARRASPRKKGCLTPQPDAFNVLTSATPVWPSMAAAPGGLRRGQQLRTPRRDAAARDLIFASRRLRAFGRVSTERARRGSPTGSSDGTLSWAIAAAPFARMLPIARRRAGRSRGVRRAAPGRARALFSAPRAAIPLLRHRCGAQAV